MPIFSHSSPPLACLSYLFLSWLIHFVTTASIHSSSLPLAAASPLLVFVGGWKATFRPSWRGSCFAKASRLAFGSREKGIDGCGPTEPRGGTVIDIERVGVATAGVAGGAVEGECALGRLLRFSTVWSSASTASTWLINRINLVPGVLVPFAER